MFLHIGDNAFALNHAFEPPEGAVNLLAGSDINLGHVYHHLAVFGIVSIAEYVPEKYSGGGGSVKARPDES